MMIDDIAMGFPDGEAIAEKCERTGKELMARIAENANRLMMEHNLSIRRLSLLTGVSVSCMWRLLHGKTNANISTLVAIAVVFDVDVAQLLVGLEREMTCKDTEMSDDKYKEVVARLERELGEETNGN